MVKWISQQSSELSLGVRIPLGAQQGAQRRCAPKKANCLAFGRDSKEVSLSASELIETYPRRLGENP